MTPEFNNARKANLYRGGTFWYEHLVAEQRPLVRALFHTVDQTGAWQALHTIPQTVTPSGDRDQWHQVIRFTLDSVLYVLINPSERADVETGDVYSTFPVPKVFEVDHTTGLIFESPDPRYWEEHGYLVLVPANVDPTRWTEIGYTGYSYLVPYTGGLVPHIIRNQGSYFFAGYDFYTTPQGIVFNQDPGVLFPDGRVHVVYGIEPSKTIFPYPAGIDPSAAPGVMVNRYLRTTHSPTDLVAALNEVIGLDAFTVEGEVRDVLPCEDDSTLYVLDSSVVRIRQPHTYIPIGDRVSLGQVPGALITAKCQAIDGDQWFDGYELPVNGLPAASVLQYADSDDRIPPGLLQVTELDGHAQFSLGTSYLSSELFNINRQRTDELGSTSFSTHVLDNLDADDRFDLLGFLFTWVWKYTGMIITYSRDKISEDDVRRVRDFLYRNQPVNAVVFLLPDK